ncbi:MAG: UvrD-helicase domain-containing protein [Rhodoglobus sp.]
MPARTLTTRSASPVSSPNGQVVLASAGSGKTTWIARQVAGTRAQRCAVTTFTVLNAERLRSRITIEAGLVPPRTAVLPWFTFLLQDLIRPYQMSGDLGRIGGLNFVEARSVPFAKKAQRRYWVDPRGYVYSDKIAELALSLDMGSNGAVLRRLRRLYAHIYIDEFQDLAGYDLDLIERMLAAGLTITMVGDPRQATYSTNPSARNKKYRGAGVARKVDEWAARGLCNVTNQAHSYRCAPWICSLADLIYPELPTTEPRYEGSASHRGTVIVRSHDVQEYLDIVRPQVLRHDKCSHRPG